MADQSISVSYGDAGQGGMPYVFISRTDATALNLCNLGTGSAAISTGNTSGGSSSGGGSSKTGSAGFGATAPHPAIVGAGVLVLVAAGAFGRFYA